MAGCVALLEDAAESRSSISMEKWVARLVCLMYEPRGSGHISAKHLTTGNELDKKRDERTEVDGQEEEHEQRDETECLGHFSSNTMTNT
jgi:hypothetical protein